jgi:hypothetical protein
MSRQKRWRGRPGSRLRALFARWEEMSPTLITNNSYTFLRATLIYVLIEESHLWRLGT